MAEQPSDDRLIVAATRGDRGALEALLKRHEAHIRAYAARVAPRPDLADDCAQETFTAALGNLAAYRGGNRFAAWLRGICRNQAQRQWAQIKRMPDRLHQHIEDLSETVASSDNDERLKRLRSCLEHLQGKTRDILRLRFVNGSSTDGIAETIGMAAGSVRSIISRSYASLRDCIDRSSP